MFVEHAVFSDIPKMYVPTQNYFPEGGGGGIQMLLILFYLTVLSVAKIVCSMK
jgi:hypothetical protein